MAKMELRFILEHAEASVAAARQLQLHGESEGSALVLMQLSEYLTARMQEGVLEPPNIDIKPEPPE